MDYEKAYKEALERATKLAFTNNISATAAGEIFPELRESEDEKIRKELIRYLPYCDDISKDTKERWIAWLEKQGNYDYKRVNLNNFDARIREFSDMLEDKPKPYWDGWYEAMEWVRTHGNPFEKQGEQKPVEQDTETHDLWVYIREWNDKFGRLPKDEDELASCIDYVMKRQKPADKVEKSLIDWSEEDDRILYNVIAYIGFAAGQRGVRNDAFKEANHWLKSLKDRVQLQTKQEWNKEDEKKIMWLVRLISTVGYRELETDKMPCSRIELIDWLKSLKPRWKPSEQNIKDLEWCADLVKDKMGVGFHRLQVFIDEIKNL